MKKANHLNVRRAGQLIIMILVIPVLFHSCRKDWLDAKPIQSQVTLNSLKSLQGLMDNTFIFNTSQFFLASIGTDEHYMDSVLVATLIPRNKNYYLWEPASAGPDYYVGSVVPDWDKAYNRIFTANTALEEIARIVPSSTEIAAWSNIKGSALFYRTYSYYFLAQTFCKTYMTSTAASDPGIVLPVVADVNLRLQRSTVKQTYEQIISDLMQAKYLLPVTPLYKTRPSRPAVYAMLSRVYLTMGDYAKAGAYADSCLAYYVNDLLDYNSLNASLTYPMPLYPQNNVEVIFHAEDCNSSSMVPVISTRNNGSVDTAFYNEYASDDLRKTLYFKIINGRICYGGGYDGYVLGFMGLATDELFLTRAECSARAGNKDAAMADLNKLLRKRWKNTVSYPDMTATDAEDALQKVLKERKKELCFRNIRWTDLRRLNPDPRFQVTITRYYNGQAYTLLPNSNQYVWPIPYYEILNAGLEQNPR